MAGVSHKTPVEPWGWVLTKAGWENVAEMSRETGLSDDILREYVYKGSVPSLVKAARIAEAAKIDLNELAKRLARK